MRLSENRMLNWGLERGKKKTTVWDVIRIQLREAKRDNTWEGFGGRDHLQRGRPYLYTSRERVQHGMEDKEGYTGLGPRGSD